MGYPAILGFAAVSVAIIAVPGPSVLFAVSRAVVAGRRAALLTVLGNATGLFAQVLLVAFGVGLIVTGSDLVHGALKLVGAAYLVWLGVSAIRRRHDAARALGAEMSATSRAPLRDGFVVGVSNPKSIIFLAALLPQYVAPEGGPVAAQMIALGALFCCLAIVGDGAWAVLAARARSWLSGDPRRLTWMSVGGGLVMIALGLLLATG